jgi:hypothetical protein
MGNFEEGLAGLENAPTVVQGRLYWLPMLDPVCDTPEFRQLLVKLGCAEKYKVARETLARMLKEQAAGK